MTRAPVRSRLLLLPLLMTGVTGCAAPDTRGSEAPVVYGTDDREDVYAHPSASLRTLAHESIVALIRNTRLEEQMDGGYERTPTLTLGEAYDLCADQRFIDQPTSAFCSGTLVAPDIVVTAGHCIETLSECQGTSFVFDYLYTADGVLAPLEADDVYGCTAILSRQDGVLDYAYLRLDREVVGHTPATLSPGVGSTCRNVVDEEAVAVLGFGSGLPLKIDDGGAVTNPSSRGTNFFLTSLDTFAGNSGSGVFNTDGVLVGVLSSGLGDYRERAGEGCDEVNTLSETFGAEQIGHLLPTLLRYCDDAAAPDSTLCAAAEAACPGGPMPDLGMADLGMSDAGTDPDVGIEDDAGSDGAVADMGAPRPGSSGCGCRVTGEAPVAGPAAWLVALLASLGWRRRRRANAS